MAGGVAIGWSYLHHSCRYVVHTSLSSERNSVVPIEHVVMTLNFVEVDGGKVAVRKCPFKISQALAKVCLPGTELVVEVSCAANAAHDRRNRDVRCSEFHQMHSSFRAPIAVEGAQHFTGWTTCEPLDKPPPRAARVLAWHLDFRGHFQPYRISGLMLNQAIKVALERDAEVGEVAPLLPAT